MRRIFPTRRPTNLNFKLGRQTEPRFAKVTILIQLSRLQRLTKILNNTRHRAASLRQLSFLFALVCCMISLPVRKIPQLRIFMNGRYSGITPGTCSTASMMIQEARLSQRDRAMLRVIDSQVTQCHSRSFKMTRLRRAYSLLYSRATSSL